MGDAPANQSPYSPTPGSVSLPHHARSNVGSASLQSQSQTHSFSHDSAAVSETWSPSSSHSTWAQDLDTKGQENTQLKGKPKAEKGNQTKVEDEDEDPPAWSELKTKAGKERKRLPLACIACRRKKIRCSGEKPSCKHCVKSGIPCVYKVTARKAAAPRNDYMALLEGRMRRMEDRVIRSIPKEELAELSPTGRAVVRPALPAPATKAIRSGHTKKRSADEAFSLELEAAMSSQGKSVTESAHRSKTVKQGEKSLMEEGAEFLPSKDIQQHLAEIYFDYVYGQSYLLLHKPSFMRKLKEDKVPPVLVLAICAISARFSTHPELNTDPAFSRGDSWAKPARLIIEKRHSEPNMTILIVLVLLGLHYFGTCEGGLSWSFGGQAMRMAYALQLHRELYHDPLGHKNDKTSELTFTDREIRRRTMWASFLMDRFSASGTERPPFGNEDFLRIQLPIKESLFQLELPGRTEDLEGNIPCAPTSNGRGSPEPRDNMGVAAYVIRAVVLWGRIVQYLNMGGKEKDKYPIWRPESGFAKLRQCVDSFKKEMPPSMVYSEENLQIHAAERVANQYLYLHIICEQNMLFLYRFAIPLTPNARPSKEIPKKFLNDAIGHVVGAAGQISHLVDQAAGHVLTAPFAGYCAYVASTVQVWGIFSQNPQLEALSKENLKMNYKYLHKMKKYWGMLHFMVANVKDIYRHFADAARKGVATSTDSSDGGSPLWQYGDWFDKYPQGLSGQSWEELSADKKKDGALDAAKDQRTDVQSVEDFFGSLSPPSKTEAIRKVVKKQPKKPDHKNHATISQSPASRKPRAAHPRSKPTEHSDPSEPISQPQSQPYDPSVTESQLSPSSQQFLASPASQPGTFGLMPQPFDFAPSGLYPTNTLPHLDRHLVFDANSGMNSVFADASLSGSTDYGGGGWIDSDPQMTASSYSNFQDHTGGLGISHDGGALDGAGPPFDVPLDPTSAWFLPFNMQPSQFMEMDTTQIYMDQVPGLSDQGLAEMRMVDEQGDLEQR